MIYKGFESVLVARTGLENTYHTLLNIVKNTTNLQLYRYL